MNNLIKLSIIFLAFFIIFSPKSVAADRILPLPKPTVDEETKIITAKKKEIYPILYFAWVCPSGVATKFRGI